jgi:hypothetical protein
VKEALNRISEFKYPALGSKKLGAQRQKGERAQKQESPPATMSHIEGCTLRFSGSGEGDTLRGPRIKFERLHDALPDFDLAHNRRFPKGTKIISIQGYHPCLGRASGQLV